MDFGDSCFRMLKEIVEGHYHYDKVFFTLDELKILPNSLSVLNPNEVGDLVISPFLITHQGLMEAYWYSLSIKNVDSVQDKFIVFMEEAGISNLEEVEKKYVEQWDNTYFELQNGDLPELINSIKRYIAYMECQERELINDVDKYNLKVPGIYYEIS